jgi:hypothetical protein
MISFIFLALAAICNAVMDVCSHHYFNSVFRKWDLKMIWWNAELSWTNKYIEGLPVFGRKHWKIFDIKIIIPVQLTDAWHFFKMLMIIFIVVSIMTYSGSMFNQNNFIIFCIDMLIYGCVWNCTFSLFYNKLLIVKND